jgi:hypothetical protein
MTEPWLPPARRRVLPPRRYAETFLLSHGAQRTEFAITVGYYEPDVTPAEVFISGAKAGSEVEAVARDGAVLLSIALQYGVPLEIIKNSITRNEDGRPSTIVGKVIEAMTEAIADQRMKDAAP